ncbi:MAG: hypothetical protein HY043_21795 [Verrucomicrobia bacterium]|nr:hypothetical protein [Verrucomicrobiota bacterium]
MPKKSKSETAVRMAKAQDLREQIQRLKQTPPSGESPAEALPKPMSPREFIHRRMRLLGKNSPTDRGG